MANGTIKRLAGPAYLSNAAADIYNQGSALLYTVVRHIHLANVTNAARTFRLYIGASGGSAGGTELYKDYTIAANSALDLYCSTRLNSTDFLSGLADAASAITITVEGELFAA